MILHHVAQRPGLFRNRRRVLHSERFGRRDLDMIDVTIVPERFEDPIGEPQHDDVLRCFLAEEMVDSVGLIFRNEFRTIRFNSRADAKSVPNGFSTMTRAQLPSRVLFNPKAL